MARHTRIEVALAMARTGLVPLFYHPESAVVKQIVQACYEGGARVFEFTNRGDLAHEVFGEVSRYVAHTLPELMLGVGSVTDAGTASLYMQLGADFVKLFPSPGDVADYVTAVLGPLPELRIFPTAGVTPENFCDVLNAGAAGVGFVRSLFDPDDLAEKRFTEIEKRAARIVDRLRSMST